MARVLLVLFVVGVTIYALVDCLRTPASYIHGHRYLWVLGIVLLPFFGAVLYLLMGRASTGPGLADRLTSRPRALAPDDDPEFLRSLDKPQEPTRDAPDGEDPIN